MIRVTVFKKSCVRSVWPACVITFAVGGVGVIFTWSVRSFQSDTFRDKEFRDRYHQKFVEVCFHPPPPHTHSRDLSRKAH